MLLATAQDKVPCSACADWPRAPQKRKQRATRNNPALSPTQVTPGHDAERQLTREKLLHTQRLSEHGIVRLQLRETRALAKREEKTIDLGAQFFCGDSPAPRRGSESELSFTAKSTTTDGWRAVRHHAAAASPFFGSG